MLKNFLILSVIFFSVFLILIKLDFSDYFIDSKISLNILISGFITMGVFSVSSTLKSKNRFQKYERRNLATEKIINDLNNEVLFFKNLNKRYQKILDFISDMPTSSELESFANRVLDVIMEIIPDAKFGTVCTSVDDSSWKFISFKGYDSHSLKELYFKENWFEHLKEENTNIKIIENIVESPRIPEHVRKIIKSKLKQTPKKSIFCVLKHEREILGFITVDFMEDDVNIPYETLEILNSILKISSIFISLKKDYDKKTLFQEEVIKAMIRIIELKDKYTRGHSERVAEFSVKIAEKLGLSDGEIEKVYWAGIIHDIGKVGIPDEILNKPERLTDEEYEIIKRHPILGEQVINQMMYLKEFSQVIRHHHERWNGTGYPDGLKGEQIPLLSRILAVADAFDAMTSDRSYRSARSVEEALKEIYMNSGTQFDPKVVKALLDLFNFEKSGENNS